MWPWKKELSPVTTEKEKPDVRKDTPPRSPAPASSPTRPQRATVNRTRLPVPWTMSQLTPIIDGTVTDAEAIATMQSRDRRGLSAPEFAVLTTAVAVGRVESQLAELSSPLPGEPDALMDMANTIRATAEAVARIEARQDQIEQTLSVVVRLLDELAGFSRGVGPKISVR